VKFKAEIKARAMINNQPVTDLRDCSKPLQFGFYKHVLKGLFFPVRDQGKFLVMASFVVKCHLLEGLTFLEPFKIIFVPLCVLALWPLVRFFGLV